MASHSTRLVELADEMESTTREVIRLLARDGLDDAERRVIDRLRGNDDAADREATIVSYAMTLFRVDLGGHRHAEVRTSIERNYGSLPPIELAAD